MTRSLNLQIARHGCAVVSCLAISGVLTACDDFSQPTVTPRYGVGVHGGSPPGSVVFHSNRDGNAEIYSMNADGGAQIRLAESASEDIWPDISPNGRYVAFASMRTGNREIFVLEVATGELVNVSNSAGDDNWPRWSPNGQDIAFHTNRDGNYEIYAVRREGSGLRRITDNASLDQWVDWSPDGKRLAFRRGTNVWVIDAEGLEQNPVPLTNLTSVNQMPAWSPDGKQIAFMSQRAGYPSIFLMSANGETAENPAVNLTPKDPSIANSMWLSRAPVWSRNGRQIYFMSFRPQTNGDVELFVMNADGSGVTRLTSAAGEDGGPRPR